MVDGEYDWSDYPGHSMSGGGYSLIYPNTSDCQFTTLLPPLYNKRSFTGIEVRKVTNTSPISLGDPHDGDEGNKNTFDYLDYGIRVLHSNASVYDNIFMNIYNIDKNPTYDCAGVFAWDWVKPEGTSFTLIVGDDSLATDMGAAPNWFDNCTNGVYSREFNNRINFNDMDNILNDGVLVDGGNSLLNDIRDNRMYAMNYGIVVQCRSDGSTLIQDNKIHVEAQVDPHLTIAIWSFAIGSFNNYYHTNPMSIDENYIYLDDVRDGIHGTAPAFGIYAQATNDLYNITRNEIHFSDPAVYSITASKGIDLEGNDGGDIEYNTVWDETGVSTTTRHSIPYDLYGILVAQSTNTQVFNNTTYYMGSGIAAVAGCTSSQFGCNIMDNSYDGFMFYTAAIATSQLGGTTANGNCWDALGPCPTNTSTSGGYDLTGNFASSTTWHYSVNPVNDDIGTTYYIADVNATYTDDCSSNYGSNKSLAPAMSAIDKREMMLGKIVRGQNSYDTLSAQFLKNDTVYAFRVMSQYDSIMHLNTNDDTLYQSFFNHTKNRNTGKFLYVQHQVDTAFGNLSQAVAINNAITPSGTIEENRKTVNSVYLNKLRFERDTTNGVGKHYVYTDGEKNELLYVAYQNPMLGGNSVYQARVLLWIEVPDTFSRPGSRMPIHKPQTHKQSAFKLYPNPNNGTFTLEYNLNDTDNASFCIYDMTGRLVKTLTLNANYQSVIIDASFLHEGVYYYTIKDGDKNVKTEKIVIVK